MIGQLTDQITNDRSIYILIDQWQASLTSFFIGNIKSFNQIIKDLSYGETSSEVSTPPTPFADRDVLMEDAQYQVTYFPVWLPNRLLSTGLELVLSLTEKSCIVSYYIQFSTSIKMYNYNIKTVLFARAFGIRSSFC